MEPRWRVHDLNPLRIITDEAAWEYVCTAETPEIAQQIVALHNASVASSEPAHVAGVAADCNADATHIDAALIRPAAQMTGKALDSVRNAMNLLSGIAGVRPAWSRLARASDEIESALRWLQPRIK